MISDAFVAFVTYFGIPLISCAFIVFVICMYTYTYIYTYLYIHMCLCRCLKKCAELKATLIGFSTVLTRVALDFVCFFKRLVFKGLYYLKLRFFGFITITKLLVDFLRFQLTIIKPENGFKLVLLLFKCDLNMILLRL